MAGEDSTQDQEKDVAMADTKPEEEGTTVDEKSASDEKPAETGGEDEKPQENSPSKNSRRSRKTGEENDAEKEENKDEPVADGDKKRKAEEDPTEEGGQGRERRTRKTANVFAPEDFSKKQGKDFLDATGRGKKLKDIPAVFESISAKSPAADEILQLHRMLYTTRGRPAKREIKPNILEFSGYLPKREDGLSKKEVDALDQDFEEKMGTKAYKLTIPQIKKICDLLCLDRSGTNDIKDALINVLLDFLGAPHEKFLKGEAKGGAKKASAPSKSKSKKKKKEDPEEEEEDEQEEDDEQEEPDEEVQKAGELPSDAALRKWVKAYVQVFNLQVVTLKHAMQIASEKFGVDLKSKKQRMKILLTEEM